MQEIPDAHMPPGWTIARLREWSGDRRACALPLDLKVTEVTGPVPERVRPSYVLAFGDLCVIQDAETGDWLMGSLDVTAGTAQCWSNYGDSLSEAIRGL